MKPFYFNAKTGALALLLAYTFGLLLLNFLHYEIQTAGYPLQVDNSESVVLNEALRLKGGLGHLYKPLDSPPFLQVCYPPLYLWLAAKATPSSPGQLFLPGRLITFASSILIMIILAFIINRYSKSFFSVIAGLSLYVSSPLILHWSALIRVDLPGIFLMMLALALYLARPKRFAWLFIFPLLLGLFTKHTLIAFPAAIIADSLIARDKSALKSIGVFCLLGLTIFLVLSYLTDGLFYQHIVTYSILPWRPEILLNHARQFIGSHPYYPILLAFYFNPFTRPYRSFRLITLGLFFSLIEFCFSGRIGTV
ncbi:MAG: hypothetical protein KKD13_02750, partial [Candidatus Margulisbacteria bacterium]|nr:hypothetical protein [Candidatus Margulisiibacteriota bacterium]